MAASIYPLSQALTKGSLKMLTPETSRLTTPTMVSPAVYSFCRVVILTFTPMAEKERTPCKLREVNAASKAVAAQYTYESIRNKRGLF